MADASSSANAISAFCPNQRLAASKAAAIIHCLSDKRNRDPRFLAAVVVKIRR